MHAVHDPQRSDISGRRAPPRAQEQGKSLNEIAIEALARGAGISGERTRKRDLSDIVGTWQNDPAFDEAIAAQDTVDEDLWR